MSVEFAAIRPDGTIAWSPDLDEVVRDVERRGRTPMLLGGPTDAREDNAAVATGEAAFRSSAMPQLYLEDIYRISLEEAYERLRDPLLDVWTRHNPSHQFVDPRKSLKVRITQVVNAILRVNAKLEKAGDTESTNIGMVLEPHTLTYGPKPPTGIAKTILKPGRNGVMQRELVVDEQGPLLSWRELGVDPARIPALSRRSSTCCLGSSQDCRAVCLLTTGQNTTDSGKAQRARRATEYFRNVAYNRAYKKLWSTAMLAYPEHTIRILLEAIERVARSAQKKELILSLRLNVLSDYPWEYILPEFCADTSVIAPNIRLYDYTKVAGRGARDYHLSYSFSGTNWHQCLVELDRRNIVVPIVAIGTPERGEQRRGEKLEYRSFVRPPKYGGNVPLPRSIRLDDGVNRPLVDGDLYDGRWADPYAQGAVVGLRYKVPASQARRDLAPVDFILKVRQYGDVLTTAECPGLTGAGSVAWQDESDSEDVAT